MIWLKVGPCLKIGVTIKSQVVLDWNLSVPSTVTY